MRKKNKFIKRLILLGIFCTFLCIFVSQHKKFSAYNDQIKDYKQQIEKQEALSKDLAEKEDAYSSHEYVEKIAREELGMVKPGERLYVDVNNN